MKQIFLAAALLSLMAQPAEAKHRHSNSCTCANKSVDADQTVTDHSYDRAYSAHWAAEAKTPGAPVSGTAVATSGYIRKGSYAGYSMPTTVIYMGADATTDQGTYQGRRVDLPGVTVRDNAGYMRPSPYMGDDSPINDGAAKNEYRNMNVSNSSQPIPPSTGQSSNSNK